MKLQDDGDLQVTLGETVIVEIQAKDTALIVNAGPIHTGAWNSVDHPSADKEVRKFKVTEAFSKNFSFVIGFDFSLQGGKIPATAQYVLLITGDGPGGFSRPRIILPTSILPAARVITFEVQ